MKSLGLGRYALSSCVAAATLAGCGGSQPSIGAQGAIPANLIVGRIAEPRPLRTLRDQAAGPDVYKVSAPLLFVADWIKSSIRNLSRESQEPDSDRDH